MAQICHCVYQVAQYFSCIESLRIKCGTEYPAKRLSFFGQRTRSFITLSAKHCH